MAPDPDPSAALEEIRGLHGSSEAAIFLYRFDRLLQKQHDHFFDAYGWDETETAKGFSDLEKEHASVSRLLAAIEAVLELHQPEDRGAGAKCKGCATHVSFRWWPCPTYLAISRELTGKGGSDA